MREREGEREGWGDAGSRVKRERVQVQEGGSFLAEESISFFLLYISFFFKKKNVPCQPLVIESQCPVHQHSSELISEFD